LELRAGSAQSLQSNGSQTPSSSHPPSSSPDTTKAQASKTQISKPPISAKRASGTTVAPKSGSASARTSTGNKPVANSNQSPEGAIKDWLSLFQLVSKQQFSDEQKENYELVLKKMLDSPKRNEYLAVQQFWPQVVKSLDKTPDQTENFALFFRALLRFHSRAKGIGDEERSMLAEVLGAEKVAVAGDPPLTDEALDAYGDMACFMYEHDHPGKSVDATDNRAIFSSVICNKFRDAPSPADQRAMANFALTWARFKTNWAAASSEQQDQLFAQLKGTSKPTKQNANPLVDVILHNGPWAN